MADIFNFFDLETTGFSYKNGDRVIQACFAAMDASTKAKGVVYDFKLNPEGRKSAPRAYAIHKISDEELLKEPTLREYSQFILNTLQNSINVGHNVHVFDIAFLCQELYMSGIDRKHLLGIRYIDTMLISKHRNPAKGSSHNLDYLCSIYDIDTSSRSGVHSAKVDTFLTEQIFWHLLDVDDYSKFIRVVDEKYLDERLELKNGDLLLSALNGSNNQIDDSVHITNFMTKMDSNFKTSMMAHIKFSDVIEAGNKNYITIEEFAKHHKIYVNLLTKKLRDANVITVSSYATANSTRQKLIQHVIIKNSDKTRMVFKKQLLVELFENDPVLMRLYQENTRVKALNHFTNTNYKELDETNPDDISKVKSLINQPGQQMDLFEAENLRIEVPVFATNIEKEAARKKFFPQLFAI